MIYYVGNSLEVNTFSTYNKGILLGGGNIVVPYVNLIIHDVQRPIHGVSRGSFIDFSFLIFKEVKSMSWDYLEEARHMRSDVSFGNDADGSEQEAYISVFNVRSGITGAEVQICFKQQLLCLPNGFSARDHDWVPIETPAFPKNIEADYFFDNNTPPDEVFAALGLNRDIYFKPIPYYYQAIEIV